MKKRVVFSDIVVPEVPLQWLVRQSPVSLNKAFATVLFPYVPVAVRYWRNLKIL